MLLCNIMLLFFHLPLIVLRTLCIFKIFPHLISYRPLSSIAVPGLVLLLYFNLLKLLDPNCRLLLQVLSSPVSCAFQSKIGSPFFSQAYSTSGIPKASHVHVKSVSSSICLSPMETVNTGLDKT